MVKTNAKDKEKNSASGSVKRWFTQLLGADKKTKLLYLLLAALSCVLMFHKVAFYNDEILSYCLANNDEVEIRMIYLPEGDGTIIGNETCMRMYPGLRIMPADQALAHVASVHPRESFNFVKVWKNQAADTHPPLYYLLLHTICSFFPTLFSKWFAWFVNLIFILGVLYASRRLVRELTQSEFILQAVSLSLVLCSTVLNATACLRMYIMAMFWVSLETAMLVGQLDKPVTNEFCRRAALVALLGALTHYFCPLYSVLACTVFCLLLLAQKEFRAVFRFAAWHFGAAIAACAIFPATVKHLLYGQRGVQEFVPHALDFSDYGERLSQYWYNQNNELFGAMLPVLALIFFVLIFFKTQKIDEVDTQPAAQDVNALWLKKAALCTVPAILYFLVIAKTSPVLSPIIKADIKYITPIFAVSLVAVTTLVYTQLERVLAQKWAKYTITAMALLCIFGSWWNTNWESRFLYREYLPSLDIQRQFANADCYFWYGNIMPKDLHYVVPYRSVTFFPVEHYNPEVVRKAISTPGVTMLVLGFSPSRDGKTPQQLLGELGPELANWSVIQTPVGRNYEEAAPVGNFYHLIRIR